MLTDKGNGRGTDRKKNAKNVDQGIQVVSVAMGILAEHVRSV